MPFKSKAQMKACYATNGFGGKVDCAEWQKDTPKKLPKHVPKKKMGDGGPVPKSYNPLLAQNDQAFQDWYTKNTLEGRNNIPYSNKLNYDYYSYFRNGQLTGSPENHFTDLYKRPNHPTFSNESIYSTPENPGGSWKGDVYMKNGKFQWGKQMAKGGPVPKQSDYPDYESFQAAMEQFIQTSPQTPMSTDPGGQPALWHNDQTFEDGLDSQNPTKQIGSQGYGDPLYHDHSAPLKKPQNNAMDPYFMTRGLLNGAQWLSGIRDRNRQNQYMYQQYSALGQNDPVNINDYQPNPFSLYAKFGGAIKQWVKGMKEVEEMKTGGWLKNAVNPAHKGYCTPMTKSTCTPKRKAFAQLMKRKHGFHK